MRSLTHNCHQRLSIAVCAWAFLYLATWHTFADELKSTPVGVRIFYTGHSFHMFVPSRVEQMVTAAKIENHKLVGTQGIGGSRVYQHWDLADEKNEAKKALTSGKVDVFTMAAHLTVPDRGITNFTELGLKHNPKLRLLVQASWYPWDVASKAKRIQDNAQRDQMKIEDLQAAIDSWRGQLETQADELNNKHDRKAVYIVPVGDAVVQLRAMVVAGDYPGVKSQSELFSDPIGHGGPHVQALAAYCNFVAIYRISPVGLEIRTPGIDDAQHAILQKLAWETVAGYSHSGVPAASTTVVIRNPFVTPAGWAGLLQNAAVQKELKLSADTADKIKQTLGKLSGQPDEAEQAIRKLVTIDQLAIIERLNLQREGGYALFDPTISRALSISDSQKSELSEVAAINAAEHKKMRDFMARARFRSREAMEQYVEEYRKPANARLLAVLSEDQQAKLTTLLGKPLAARNSEKK